jgi:hypothetical protein
MTVVDITCRTIADYGEEFLLIVSPLQGKNECIAALC